MKASQVMSGSDYIEQASISNGSDAREDIFSSAFAVQRIVDPIAYLPKYNQNRIADPTANEQCLICCGQICMNYSCFFGCLGCPCCCGYFVPTSYAGLAQSFGRFNRLLKPGYNLINPCADQIQLVDLRLRVLNVGRHSTQTKDNVKLDVDASVSFRVINPIISHYVLGANLNRALQELTIASLRDMVGQYTLDHVLTERQNLADRSREQVAKSIPSGIKVENVFVDEIIIPAQIERDLTSAARQKRLSEATIINSKADVQSADLMRQSADLMSTKAAMQIRYLQMVQKLGESGVLVMMDIGVDKKGYK